MEVKGAVIAKGTPADKTVDSVVLTLSLVAGGDPIDMNTDSRKVVVGYRDSEQVKNGLAWTIEADGGWLVQNDGDEADTLLEDGELVELTVPLDGLETALGPNTEFTLEIKPPTGAVINLTRTTPPAIEAVMELN
jgi:archaellin